MTHEPTGHEADDLMDRHMDRHMDRLMDNPMASLVGRHALVCGASKGIGRATALALARRGAAVTALARSDELLGALEAELSAAGAAEARSIAVDLEDHGALGVAVTEVEFGWVRR